MSIDAAGAVGMSTDENARRPRPYRRAGSISSAFAEDNGLKEKPRVCPSASGGFLREEKSGGGSTSTVRRPASSTSFQSTSADRLTQSRPFVKALMEQGLQATRPANTGQAIKGRQFQDKAYYLELLREKVRSFKVEINRLAIEKAKFIKEYENQAPMNETATLLAEQIRDLRKALANYNFLLDKQNTQASLTDILQECAEVERSNNESVQQIDETYEESRNKERQLADAEETLQKLKSSSDATLANMDEESKLRYYNLLQRKTELENRLQSQSSEGERLNEEIDKLERELNVDRTKRDALKLFSDLAQLNNERALLREEVEQQNRFPHHQRDTILSDMKQDNKDILSMQKQMEQIRREIELLEEEKREIREKHSTATANTDDYSVEEEILRSSHLCASEKEAIVKLKHSIESLEEALLSGARKSGSDVKADKDISDDKPLKEYLEILTILKKQRNTTHVYNGEINVIEEKISSLEEELQQFTLLSRVQEKAERRPLEWAVRKAALQKQVDESVRLLGELESHRRSVDRQINASEQTKKIISVERSLHRFKKENASLQAELKCYAVPETLQALKEAVLKSVANYNALLVQRQSLLP
uniref:Intraflagellar transport protein 74 homolog n=1 Tax=Trichuris muris TaxID=70415 RepID=A0A5S6R4G0_TRIMR